MSRERPLTNAVPGGARKRWLRPLPVFLMLALGAGVLWFATFSSFHRGVGGAAAAGFPMPAFRLPVLNAGLLEGDTTFLSSAELKGHVVLLDYWATSCKPCIAEQPLLMELQDDYGGSGLRVVAFSKTTRPRPRSSGSRLTIGSAFSPSWATRRSRAPDT